jgi:hypothetical protein
MNTEVRIGYLEAELEDAELWVRRWRRVAFAAVGACLLLVVALVKNAGAL